MAHSFVQAFGSEAEAFRAFARLYPETVLLVDTYDTPQGVHRVVELAAALGDDCRIRGVRLDSGDLLALSREARSILELYALTVLALSWLETACGIYLKEGRRSLVECFDETVAICLRSMTDDLAPALRSAIDTTTRRARARA